MLPNFDNLVLAAGLYFMMASTSQSSKPSSYSVHSMPDAETKAFQTLSPYSFYEKYWTNHSFMKRWVT